MANRLSDSCATLCVVVLASIVSVVLLGKLAWPFFDHAMARPLPISGPIKSGYEFFIIGMDGNKPVEMYHEWSGGIAKYAECLRKDKSSKAEIEAFLNPNLKPVVWADTGRATKNYRFYLAKADLPRISAQLKSKPDEYPHAVKVEILKDDPKNKLQTLQVVVSGEETDFINIYEVKNNSVHPLKWLRHRPFETAFFMIILSPVVFIILMIIWWRLLRNMFRDPEPSDARHRRNNEPI